MKSACMITLAIIGCASAAPQRMRTQDIRRQLKPGDESKPAHADEEPYDPNLGMSTPTEMSMANEPSTDMSISTDDATTDVEMASSATSAAFSGFVSAVVIVGAYALV